jgi:hypothetical protein
LIDEGYGCALYLFEFLLRAGAGVKHKHNVERRFDSGEEDNLLFDSILVEREFSLLQVMDVDIIAVAGNDGNSHQGRINSDGFGSLLLLRQLYRFTTLWRARRRLGGGAESGKYDEDGRQAADQFSPSHIASAPFLEMQHLSRTAFKQEGAKVVAPTSVANSLVSASE